MQAKTKMRVPQVREANLGFATLDFYCEHHKCPISVPFTHRMGHVSFRHLVSIGQSLRKPQVSFANLGHPGDRLSRKPANPCQAP